jgi:hypothetical protein
MKWLISLVFCSVLTGQAVAQTLGGDAAYTFLNNPSSTQLTALGGVNISNISKDASLAFYNPALLRENLNSQFSSDFSLFFGGIKQLHAQGVLAHKASQTIFGAGVQYVHYGSAMQTDPAGNVMGEFRPSDFAIQVSAGRKYLDRWFYGVNLKFIQSNYGVYRSSAIAADFGLNYLDSAKGWQVGFLARNMGMQLKTYAGEGEDMPFDLQLGVTKRFIGSPFQVSVTTQRLHQFDLAYEDTTFNANNGFPNQSTGFMKNLFRHFVFAGQAYVGDKLEFTLAYNVLRRAELKVPNATGGLSGISFGVGLLLPKMQFRFARSQYINSTAYHQIGLNISL